MRDAFDEITSGYTDRVLGDVDVQLIASWMLIDRRLPDGGTPVERYAQRDDLPAGERDVARRMAAARLGLLRVVRVLPGRWIELHDLAVGGEVVRAISHDVSRSTRPHDLLVGRLMEGPPAPSLWGRVGSSPDRAVASCASCWVATWLARSPRAAGGFAGVMHAAARQITVMLAPALGPAVAGSKVA